MLRSLNGDLFSCRGALPVETLPIGQHTSYFPKDYCSWMTVHYSLTSAVRNVKWKKKRFYAQSKHTHGDLNVWWDELGIYLVEWDPVLKVSISLCIRVIEELCIYFSIPCLIYFFFILHYINWHLCNITTRKQLWVTLLYCFNYSVIKGYG